MQRSSEPSVQNKNKTHFTIKQERGCLQWPSSHHVEPFALNASFCSALWLLREDYYAVDSLFPMRDCENMYNQLMNRATYSMIIHRGEKKSKVKSTLHWAHYVGSKRDRMSKRFQTQAKKRSSATLQRN